MDRDVKRASTLHMELPSKIAARTITMMGGEVPP
jgi:hypothetical protein